MVVAKSVRSVAAPHRISPATAQTKRYKHLRVYTVKHNITIIWRIVVASPLFKILCIICKCARSFVICVCSSSSSAPRSRSKHDHNLWPCPVVRARSWIATAADDLPTKHICRPTQTCAARAYFCHVDLSAWSALRMLCAVCVAAGFDYSAAFEARACGGDVHRCTDDEAHCCVSQCTRTTSGSCVSCAAAVCQHDACIIIEPGWRGARLATANRTVR